VSKSASVPSVSEGGVGNQTIIYTYTITNTSSASTDPVTITSVLDDKLGDLTATAVATNGGNPIVLAPNASFTFTSSTTAPVQNAGASFTNLVTASGHDDEGDSTTAQASATINYTDVAPAITVSKTASVTSVSEGGVGSQSVTYTYTIKNTSSASTDPVTITSVVDDKLGDLTSAALAANGGNPIVLAPGASFMFTFSTTAPVQNAGTSFTNIVTASGQDDEGDGTSASASATVTYTDVKPSIAISKSASPTSVREGGVGGDQVTYTYHVTNTSPAGINDPLHNVVLGDSDGTPVRQPDLVGNNDALLEAGETWVYTLTSTPPAQNTGSTHANTANVSGADDEGNVATNSASQTIAYTNVNPAITVVKTANPTTLPPTGGPVTYTYQVTNTSAAGVNDPLTVTDLKDDRGTPLNTADDFYLVKSGVLGAGVTLTKSGGNADNLLEAGETWTYTKIFTIPAANGKTGFTNSVTVTGKDDENIAAAGSSNATVAYQAGLSGYVYLDVNSNGVKNSGENGIVNVRIRLYQKVGTAWILVATTKTNSAGFYSFASVAAGTYRIVEDPTPLLMQGINSVGTVGGKKNGSVSGDSITNIVLKAGDKGVNYNFAERLTKRMFMLH
jgi:hypothetical protein